MKDWLKNMFQLNNELFPLAAVDCCRENERKLVPIARKSVKLVKICSLQLASTSFSDGFH